MFHGKYECRKWVQCHLIKIRLQNSLHEGHSAISPPLHLVSDTLMDLYQSKSKYIVKILCTCIQIILKYCFAHQGLHASILRANNYYQLYPSAKISLHGKFNFVQQIRNTSGTAVRAAQNNGSKCCALHTCMVPLFYSLWSDSKISMETCILHMPCLPETFINGNEQKEAIGTSLFDDNVYLTSFTDQRQCCSAGALPHSFLPYSFLQCEESFFDMLVERAQTCAGLGCLGPQGATGTAKKGKAEVININLLDKYTTFGRNWDCHTANHSNSICPRHAVLFSPSTDNRCTRTHHR